MPISKIESAGLGAGTVLQVVNAQTTTLASSTAATWTDTGLTATITPKSATSKILVLVSQNGVSKLDAHTFAGINLLRNSTSIQTVSGVGSTGTTAKNRGFGVPICYLDSPATTSATTYKTQFQNEAAVGTVYVQDSGSMSSYSTITLVEIAQ